MHALVRTSAKGYPFIGKCIKCGKEDLPLNAIQQDCPNTNEISNEQALLKVLK